MNRRELVRAAALGAVLSVTGCGRRDAGHTLPRDGYRADANQESGMRQRPFGKTGLQVSEIGFGAWGIGGRSYGAVQRSEALMALSQAEELGCNFVDTAAVYGASEEILGQFLQGRRSRWVLATKYSGQPQGMTGTLEKQLSTLRTDVIDFYQVHWMPRGKDAGLLDELASLKRAGKIRFAGISLYSAADIDDVLANPLLDGFQVAFSLLNPDPFLACRKKIAEYGKAVIVRSALEEGFLTGKYRRDASFPDPNDQRHKLTREQIEQIVDRVERFRFLEKDAGSMVAAAARYPLSFPEVSTVILGTKSARQAAANFGTVPGQQLSPESLRQIDALQIELGLGSFWSRWRRRLRL